ncbi:WD40 repeat domain-containing protein [Pseudanabaena sp. UWO311]|uniref:WD40 repeat domain-containing protein n=1 Tax=Pseudanabaena sp. UWO311 TaxID=2487337 RepID=UPI001159C396|nr:WD40 repeat domain-containing protein [Pseudanabaena sp. UWO311]TYQ28047.1 WD40 repeat domain-containing protein [Pseudanabaena sp. UWO311]
MSDRTDIIAENNRDALRRLTRIVTRSQGFSLSIALCNYRVLQERVLHDLRSQLAENNLPEAAIAILELKPDAKTLLAPIQELMGEVHQLPTEQKPKVLMVLGLDAVTEIEAVLKSANRVREEFANCLEFPMVLWLNDRTQDILTREASDLANWTTAGAIAFQLEAMELRLLVQDSIEAIFDRYLQSQGLGDWNASLQQFELITAIAELEGQAIEVSDELRAGLDFAFGCMAMNEGGIEKAKALFERSLAFWRHLGNQLKQATCLLQLGMCDRSLAMRERYQKQPFYATSQQYLAESIDIFRNLQRGELMALYINFLTATWEELLALSPSGAEGLESLVNEALSLHQIYPNLLRESHDRGILASVKLMQQDYRAAKESAESALALYAQGEVLQLSNLAPSRRYGYAKYELWLAQALEGLGERQGAIARLEGVRDRWLREQHPYDAQIYVSVLEELRSLYTASGLYLEAFETKQHQRSVEQQYGLRAFIGAGTLNPKRERTNFDMYANVAEQSDKIAQEIEASGRMLDVEKLVDRIGQARYPLTVIHGDSGAGKSSILSGGLVPALRTKGTIDGRKVLVFAIKNYKDWSAEVKHKLQKYFGDRRPDLDPIHHFKRNIDENYLTVLIFDQFEDFFFKKEDFRDRLPFYKFLKACLHTDFVRVVLSLREDYLHYLLECDRAVDLEKVENDILGKQVRYYLGDFTQDQARQVIEALTRRSQLRLEPELIDRLVTDLSGEQLRILPIELQVVGAQLESEVPPIANLREYLALTGDMHRKPSEVLVERWLENVVRDCGGGNKELAERVLYALTGNEEKRPQKTQAELALELLGEVSGNGLGFRSPLPPLQRGALDTLGSIDNSVPLSKGEAEGRGIEPLNEAENLSLVLAVLVGSGLAFRVSSSPDDRFQLIHDYLVSFIRKKYRVEMIMMEKFLEERKRRELAEREKDIYAVANRKAKQRIWIASIFLGIASVAAIVIGIYAVKTFQDSQEALAITQIEKQSAEAERLFKTQEFQALLPAVRSAKLLKTLIKDSQQIDQYPSVSPLSVLQLILRDGRERLQFRANSVVFAPNSKRLATCGGGIVRIWDLDGKEITKLQIHPQDLLSVVFSPNGKRLATRGSDGIMRIWDLDGKEIAKLQEQPAYGSMVFSPDSKRLAANSGKGTALIWDLDGKEIVKLKGQWDFGSVAFSFDGKRLATSDSDGTVRIWDLEGKEISKLKGHQVAISSVAFSPEGKRIAAKGNDGTLQIWDLDSKEQVKLKGYQGAVLSMTFSPKGERIVTSSSDGTARIWDLDGKEILQLKGHQGSVLSVIFSPEGNRLATSSSDRTARIWDLDGKEIAKLKGHQGSVLSIIFSPEGNRLATSSSDGTARIWDLDGKEIAKLKRYQGYFLNMVFSPDNQKISTIGSDGITRVWDLEGKEQTQLRIQQESISKEIVSPENKRITTRGSNGIRIVWDLEGKEQTQLQIQQKSISKEMVSPENKRITTLGSDGTVRIFDLEGNEIAKLQAHQGDVLSMVLSPEGKRIATSGGDGTNRIWDLQGRQIAEYQGYGIMREDFQFIATIPIDNPSIVKLWRIQTLDEMLDSACARLRPYLITNPDVSESDRKLCDK